MRCKVPLTFFQLSFHTWQKTCPREKSWWFRYIGEKNWICKYTSLSAPSLLHKTCKYYYQAPTWSYVLLHLKEYINLEICSKVNFVISLYYIHQYLTQIIYTQYKFSVNLLSADFTQLNQSELDPWSCTVIMTSGSAVITSDAS